MARVFEITEKEQAMLDAWANTGSITAAAKVLEIPQSTMSNRKSRLQWRYKRAKDFCRQVERQSARLPGALE
jgi:molybdenum-dependent DNA-binding transcriptional regulator ModE